ncbi:hypothetical protein ACA910_003722 [Epithemia clementina (nom. ined.)]
MGNQTSVQCRTGKRHAYKNRTASELADDKRKNAPSTSKTHQERNSIMTSSSSSSSSSSSTTNTSVPPDSSRFSSVSPTTTTDSMDRRLDRAAAADLGALKKKTTITTATAAQQRKTLSETVVEAWIRAFNEHNVYAAMAVTADNSLFEFPDAEMEMLAQHFYDSVRMAFASIPNMKFQYDSIQSIADEDNDNDEDRVLVVRNFFGHGTHTGEPYSFGPYPPLPARGATFRDAPMDITITIQNGKIAHFSCDAKGKMVGPPGIYEQLGGILL